METYILAVSYQGRSRRGVSVGETLEAATEAFRGYWPEAVIKSIRLATPAEIKRYSDFYPSALYAG
jgi:hypothetical protein